jgi:hypothetical protein
VRSIIESESVTINLWRRSGIPTRLLLVSSDLQARVRVGEAAEPLGLEVAAIRPGPGRPALEADLVVLDLDEIGAVGEDWLGESAAPPNGPRVVGFFSHVQEEAGARARAAGIEVYPRGRFWRDLPLILSGKSS